MLASLFERRVINNPFADDARGFSPVGGGRTSSGQAVTQTSALTLLHVFAAQSFIADVISTLPVSVFRRENDQPVEVTPPPWVENPNPEVDRVGFVSQCVSSWLGDGNLFVIPVRPGGEVAELWTLDPEAVHIRRARAGGPRIYTGTDGRAIPAELIHVPGFLRPGALRGLSPVEQARQSIGLGLAAVDHGARVFSNGAFVSGVIESPGAYDKDQARDLKEGWGRAHSRENAYTPGVLFGGAQWKPSSLTMEQTQFLESRNFTGAEICALHHLDPSWLGLGVAGSNLTYENLEQRGIHLAQFTLLRWLVRLERMFTALLPAPEYLKFNVGGLLRGDLAARFAAYRIALGPDEPFMVTDEVRDLEDRGPMPEPEIPPPPAAAPPRPAPEPRVEVHTHNHPPAVSVDARTTFAEGAVQAPTTVDQSTTEVIESAPDVTVNVAAPDVTVNVPEPEPVERTVVRDETGRITGMRESRG